MPDAVNTPDWAHHPELVEFYSRHRSRPADLYPSERRFLPWAARRSASVLDAGCAAGGFSNIWRHYRPDIAYSGVDVSASLVEAARRLYPGHRFVHANVTSRSELPDRVATTVQAFGWLFWEPQYASALAELWRLTDRYLLFDLRVVERDMDASHGRQRVAYSGTWDGVTTTPYVTVGWRHSADLIARLRPKSVYGFGYWGKPAATVENVQGDVCFAVFLLERPNEDERVDCSTVCLDMPLSWPAGVLDGACVLPGERLADLVPRGDGDE